MFSKLDAQPRQRVQLSTSGDGFLRISLSTDLKVLITSEVIKTLRAMAASNSAVSIFEGLTLKRKDVQRNGNRRALYKPSIEALLQLMQQPTFLPKEINTEMKHQTRNFIEKLREFLALQPFVIDMQTALRKEAKYKTLSLVDTIAISVMSSFNENPKTSSKNQVDHFDFHPDGS